MNPHYVYILASKRNGTLYIGETADLFKRTEEHKGHLVKGFTKKYGVTILVHYESCETRDAALYREKQLKEWKRQWKIELIEKANPLWKDLYNDIVI